MYGKHDMLEKLALQIQNCTLCPLWKSRNNAVAGEGSANAKIMFVGEAPGKHEDATGRPFVGPAGKLLDECLKKAGIERNKVFITSAVKCRPPKNRTPTRKEVLTCRKYLLRQIDIIKPELIVALGKIGAYTLLLRNVNMLECAGEIYHTKLGRVFVTLHPAFVLRFRKFESKFIDDLKKVKRYVS